MEHRHIKDIIRDLRSGDLSTEQLDRLIDIADSLEHRAELAAEIDRCMQEDADEVELDFDYQTLEQAIDEYVVQIPQRKPKIVPLRHYIVWAAACLLLICSPLLRRFIPEAPLERKDLTLLRDSALQEQAYLQVHGEGTLSLDSIPVGANKVTGGVVLSKKSKNELVYTADTGETVPTIQQISLVTKSRDSYKVTLPDGTMVWLNANSSISFPSRFSGENRIVSAQGELFFQVVHHRLAQGRPFVVEVNQQKIKVLGTAFNVRAYPSQKVQTSLVHGRVELSTAVSRVNIFAGQQAEMDGEKGFILRSFDVDRVTAWRGGYFVFRETSLQEVLTDLSHWYGFSVQGDRSLRSRVTAKIKKDIDLKTVLRSLEEITPYRYVLIVDKLIIERK